MPHPFRFIELLFDFKARSAFRIALVYNLQQQMKGQGNIKVFCRFRPFNSKELAANPTILHRISKGTQLILKDSNKPQGISFMFDQVFDINSKQEQVFEKVGEPVINNILDGFHGTIMAYGQTSSGKTHTMQGYDVNQKENRGIMPRMIENLFTAIEKSPESVEFKLKISIFELYMEKVRDLLDVSKSDLRIREGKQGNYIENLTEVYVTEKLELFRIISIGQKNRMTCATNMNEHSSRSHLIFLLTLNQTIMPDGASKTSKLFLIDLAGSEKISKTGAEGKVLEEAKKINLSLTNLGKVIKALSQRGKKQGHVPYRDSKLTKILKDSLGGNSKTTLIVTCSPHEMHLPQTISTLRFGENAQKIKNKPKINRELTVQELMKIVEKLEGDLTEKDNRIKCLERYITGTLKAELPTELTVLLNEQKEEEIETQPAQTVLPSESRTEVSIQLSAEMEKKLKENQKEIQWQMRINEEAQQRVKLLQQELHNYQSKMKGQMDKFYHLKKQYHDLRDHTTSILSQNIELKDQLQEKRRKLQLNDKSLTNNAYLIRMIVGEILSSVEKEHQSKVEDKVKGSYWYQKIMMEGVSCTEYWQAEKEKLSKQLQAIANQSQTFESQVQQTRRREQSRVQKDNEKILQLQRKLGLIFDEYNSMMALQTHWKAECQLYERNLRKKDQDILRLQKEVQRQEEIIQGMHVYQQNDDIVSIRSNTRLVKPLKGGFFMR